MLNRTVELQDGVFPEFDRHRQFTGVTATVFDEPSCAYDVILGRNLLQLFIIDFANQHVKWMDNFIFMKPRQHFQHHTNWTAIFDDGVYDVLDDVDDAFIMDAKYKATSGKEVADRQGHLNKSQRQQLAAALKNTAVLFDGKLGHFKAEKIHLEVEDGAVPVHAKAYSVPTKYEPAFLKELSISKRLEC